MGMVHRGLFAVPYYKVAVAETLRQIRHCRGCRLLLPLHLLRNGQHLARLGQYTHGVHLPNNGLVGGIVEHEIAHGEQGMFAQI